MPRNTKDFHHGKGYDADALNRDIENAKTSYDVEAAHEKHNPRPKGPHADELEAASKNGGLTMTTQAMDSKDDR